MKDNKKTLEQISIPMQGKIFHAANERKEGKLWRKKSRQIALSILYHLEKKGLDKKQLAERINADPSFVDRILSGKENLSLDSISQIEQALGVELIIVNAQY